MFIDGIHSRTIWTEPEAPGLVHIIDQRFLPHKVVIEKLETAEDAAKAIQEMHVRGAPLIGATAAYGMYLAALESVQSGGAVAVLQSAAERLRSTRPTAVDLHHATTGSMEAIMKSGSSEEWVKAALDYAERWCETSVTECRRIGEHGLSLLESVFRKTQKPVQVLTHCNAGWLACIDYGTATAPIYLAHQEGVPVHVWVDETRPRNQGSRLTAFELGQQGVPHTIITDNAGGHLMQHGMVDLVITGTDRTTRNGDVANKIGTYLKALAAHDNEVPFYVALPSSSIDWTIADGISEIPIEQRGEEEVKFVGGLNPEGRQSEVLVCPLDSPAANYGFDVTPARLITGLVTERGICAASAEGLGSLFPEQRREK